MEGTRVFWIQSKIAGLVGAWRGSDPDCATTVMVCYTILVKHSAPPLLPNCYLQWQNLPLVLPVGAAP